MQTVIEVIKHRYFAFPMEQTDRDREIDSQFTKSDFFSAPCHYPIGGKFSNHYALFDWIILCVFCYGETYK